ncbi:MAG: holo-[acyl-carrier-protein] synthase [Sphingobacteriales bacterium]|nr:MAG: holo-[acyl-carrier-protein] synthase [Sphingobacteriales bacterium]
MIVGIGCDIVEHNMIKVLEWEADISIQQTIFSAEELKLYESRKGIKFLAGRFAAKEAAVKSLGTGMRDGIPLNNIQILNDSLGKPELIISGEVKKISDLLGIRFFQLSISHSTNYSIAVVIAQG